MRPCYVNLETEAKVESLKKEVTCGEDREQDIAASPMNNACDEDYDYYPEDNYYEEPGNNESSPAKKRKVEPLGENKNRQYIFDALPEVHFSDSSTASPVYGESEEDILDTLQDRLRRSRSSQSCSNTKCPNIRVRKKRRRKEASTSGLGRSMMKNLREDLPGGLDDRPTDSDSVRKAKKQLR